jgi:hypothetical protein
MTATVAAITEQRLSGHFWPQAVTKVGIVAYSATLLGSASKPPGILKTQ